MNLLQEANAPEESGDVHGNNFFGITVRFFQEVLKLFKYIFYDVFFGKNP